MHCVMYRCTVANFANLGSKSNYEFNIASSCGLCLYNYVCANNQFHTFELH